MIVQEFTSITPKTNFKMYNAFADKDENLELPGSVGDFVTTTLEYTIASKY